MQHTGFQPLSRHHIRFSYSASDPKHPASYDKARYRQRNQIERLVGRLKRYRRIATRYDRRAAYFLAAIHIVATLEWLT